ncbi:hypothetical protein [Mycetohabitans endofungorum]|uniref:hypothetical protein n=1 Tax=Mycetohabitans endofungorum TaxID=417203 RepID=UPI001304D646|nr:hypothetical protein [Mycetohabitans endofungorum]
MTSFLRWKPFSQVSTGPKIAGQVSAGAGRALDIADFGGPIESAIPLVTGVDLLA